MGGYADEETLLKYDLVNAWGTNINSLMHVTR